MRAGVQSGDPDVFAELFDRYARAVYNHGFRATGMWSAAEDVVALTFLEAWRLRDRVHLDGGSLLPWLLGIATNVARNTVRAARRHQAAMARLPAVSELVTPDFAGDVVSRIDDANTVAAVRRAVSELRQGERDVVALVAWAGLDQAAAAEALGISVGTVRSRLSRARAKLRAARDGAERGRERKTGSGQVVDGHATATRTGQEARDEH